MTGYCCSHSTVCMRVYVCHSPLFLVLSLLFVFFKFLRIAFHRHFLSFTATTIINRNLNYSSVIIRSNSSSSSSKEARATVCGATLPPDYRRRFVVLCGSVFGRKNFRNRTMHCVIELCNISSSYINY